jgi:hypothetical protein
MHVKVHIYVCFHVRACGSAYVYIVICEADCRFVSSAIFVCMYVTMYVRAFEHVRIYVCRGIYTYIYTHMYVYTLIYTHACMQLCRTEAFEASTSLTTDL